MTAAAGKGSSTASKSAKAKTAGGKKSLQTDSEARLKVLVRVRPAIVSSEENHEQENQDANSSFCSSSSHVSSSAFPSSNQPQQQNMCCLRTKSSTTVELWNHRSDKETLNYSFDACFPPETSQLQVFNEQIKNMISLVLKGKNVSVFAYGPTGCGKTFTMQGSTEAPGVIPRSVKHLCKLLKAEKAKNAAMAESMKLEMAYLEIYNEKVFDLLSSKSASTDLPIREDYDKNIFIPGLTMRRIDAGFDAFDAAYKEGIKNRRTAATNLNSHSSRSHAVLMIRYTCSRSDKSGSSVNSKKVNVSGKLYLIDLAGSEDNRRTDNVGLRLTESGAINKSLFVLGKVVDAINNKLHRIPYRDSKLTRLLQDSLGGNSHAVMITNVASQMKFYQDTYSALNFASKSKNIVNKPFVNEDEIAQPLPVESNEKTGKVRKLFGDNSKIGNVKRVRLSNKTSKCPNTDATEGRKLSDGFKDHQADTFIAPAAIDMKKKKSHISKPKDSGPRKEGSRVLLSPLLRQQKVIDANMQARLEVLERKLSERQAEETKPAFAPQPSTSVAELMSPCTKSKIAKSYIAMANQFRKEGNASECLNHYKTALFYLPENEKLKAKIEKMESGPTTTTVQSDIENHKPESDGNRPSALTGKKAVASNMNAKKAEIGIKEATKSANSALIQIDRSLKQNFIVELLNTLNSGDMTKLISLNGIGKKKAELIQQHIATNGPLQELSGLEAVGFREKSLNNFITSNFARNIQIQ
eukprot:Nk52_evm4s343 gene=Nk52_evmTU4s343